MNNLPKDVYMEILLKLHLRDILSFCLTAKRYDVMNSENFWRRKMVSDGYKHFFDKYIPSQKEIYKLVHSDHILILGTVDSYFVESVGNFSKYVNIEKYKKDLISNVYEFRENILTKRVAKNEYGYYEIPKTLHDMFPVCHFEVFDDLYIFNNLIAPLLHLELTCDGIIHVYRIEPAFYRDVETGFILTILMDERICAFKIEENGIWRDLTKDERAICLKMGISVRLQQERDKEIEKVIVLPNDNGLGGQYEYFFDIAITINHHFVIYKNIIAFKIAEGPIWRDLTDDEKRIAISLGLIIL